MVTRVFITFATTCAILVSSQAFAQRIVLTADTTIQIPAGVNPTVIIKEVQATTDLAGFHLTFQCSNSPYSSGIMIHGPFLGATDGADSVTVEDCTLNPTVGFCWEIAEASVHLIDSTCNQDKNFSNLTSPNGGHGQDMMEIFRHSTVHANNIIFGAVGGGNFADMVVVNSELDWDSCNPATTYCGYMVLRGGGHGIAHIVCDQCRIQYGGADGSDGLKTWVYWNGVADYDAVVIVINNGVVSGEGQTFDNGGTHANMHGAQCQIETGGALFTGMPATPNIFGAAINSSCINEGGKIE